MARDGSALRASVEAVLFDLDGTLVDSAPDLAGAANELRQAHGLQPVAFEQLRPMVGSGARGMLNAAFGIGPGDPQFDTLRTAFLARYEARILRETRVFVPMEPVLAALERRGLPWGIVTNKIARFSVPLVEGLGLMPRCAVLISGDSTPHAKPHPQPLLEAARRLGLAPQRCIYIGDDRRDVEAGRSARMPALAAAWGYLGRDESVHDWSADAVLSHPDELLNWLGMT
ncbi:MAG: phosphoglycolate phosphatase [Burkholderiaceae bacterium]|nr:phosphoglycolate phosphatase [Burkholderiaceae bacterium]